MPRLRHAPLPDGFRLERLAAGARAAGMEVAVLEGRGGRGGAGSGVASGAPHRIVAFGEPSRVVEGREGAGLAELARALAEPLAIVGDRAALEPFPWIGGAVGYLAYECNRFFERVPTAAEPLLGLPQFRWIFPRAAAVEAEGARSRFLGIGLEAERDFGRALDEALALERAGDPERSREAAPPVVPLWPAERYLASAARVLEHIAAGDVYQANLSQPFEARGADDPLAVHARLSRDHPAPYAGFLGFGDRAIVSASPELFLSRRGSRLVTRPIKGTRPRTGDPAADAAAFADLDASEKDRAELAMIVDLERNDLSRVCRAGTVRVERPRDFETYPTLRHGVATVSGELRAEASLLEILAATFPSGSITGCPKIRAMEILHALEREPRGPSFGAIGWIGYDGNFDLNVAIRTISFARRGGAWDATFRTGGGIVAESDPRAEYQESFVKARALARALGEPHFSTNG